MDGLKDTHRAAIVDVIRSNDRVERAVLFGSRAMGTFSSASDLDIALFGIDLTISDQANMAEAMEELTIPQRVDLVLYDSLEDQALQTHIQQVGVKLYDRRIETLRQSDFPTLEETTATNKRNFSETNVSEIPPKKEDINFCKENWPDVALGDVVSLHKKQVTPAKTPDFQFSHHSIPAFDDGKRPIGELGKMIKSNKYTVPEDAVLVSRLNPRIPRVWLPNVGKDRSAICSTEFLVLRPNSIDRQYLRYTCESSTFQSSLIARLTGTSGSHQRVLPKSALDIEIPLPPLSEQRSIASVLASLDEKIELNRQMNETLESIAQAIFKDWFVDFGPTRAKMEGRSRYLTDELWDKFPDRYGDNGLPSGFCRANVNDLYHLKMGQSPPGNTYNDDDNGVVFFQGRADFGFRFPQNRKFCTAPKRFAEKDDTLVSVRAPVGDINMAWTKCCIGRGLAALRHRSGSRSFTYYSASAIQHILKQYEQNGTVFGAINKSQFEALDVIEPIHQLVLTFEEIVDPMDERIRKNTEENRILAKTRDVLLPKLISGQIRIPDAEKIVEEVV